MGKIIVRKVRCVGFSSKDIKLQNEDDVEIEADDIQAIYELLNTPEQTLCQIVLRDEAFFTDDDFAYLVEKYKTHRTKKGKDNGKTNHRS